MSVILVYVTHENLVEAKKITNLLLSKKLVACANMHQIESSYWWEGDVKDEAEVVTIYKSRSRLWEKVRDAIQDEHPYDTPCIIRIQADANKEYEDWIAGVTTPKKKK